MSGSRTLIETHLSISLQTASVEDSDEISGCPACINGSYVDVLDGRDKVLKRVTLNQRPVSRDTRKTGHLHCPL